ncbi:hypothetical protein NDU88_003439 [Pleurodeles waltl]|uniref:Uncharacterized protein n=1 Tax=Pleurodeles waltl TaxID=8319 RepID=A0AAV7Q9E8_PLEWA|nr:hypothetical protein NDU88_003439 [Pleurodeles waltl]
MHSVPACRQHNEVTLSGVKPHAHSTCARLLGNVETLSSTLQRAHKATCTQRLRTSPRQQETLLPVFLHPSKATRARLTTQLLQR